MQIMKTSRYQALSALCVVLSVVTCNVATAADLTLGKGVEFDCSPFPAIQDIGTSLPGMVSCITLKDVKSITGDVVFQQGTKLVGETDAQKRVIAWSAAVTPKGLKISLPTSTRTVFSPVWDSHSAPALNVFVADNVSIDCGSASCQ
jgi:hypothetical protein